MILEYIKLKNIRSYTSAEIKFRKGSSLLSGDIGSGKSSILLAAEFALFGIMRGKFSGETLLRGGTDEAEVELGFSIGKDKHVIKRVLKRSSRGIQQSSGYIITNGVKKEGTSIELKSDILDILGYSRDLAAKSKDLVYRYTVYTPQEQMKEILMDDRESRLDILRKVFGIEKYKIIKTNSTLVSRAVKESIKGYEGKSDRIIEKKEEYIKISKEIDDLKKAKQDKVPMLAKKKELESEAKKGVSDIEDRINACNALEKEYALLGQKLNDLVSQRGEIISEVRKLDEEVKVRPEKAPDPKLIEALIKKKELILDQLRKDLSAVQSESVRIEDNISSSKKITEKIVELDTCPTCEQDVDESYKEKVKQRQDKTISDFNEKKKVITVKLPELQKEIKTITEEIDIQRALLTKARVLIQKEKGIAEKLARIDSLKKRAIDMKDEIGKINSKKIEVSEKVKTFKDVKELHAKAIKGLDSARKETYAIDKELAMIGKELQGKQELSDVIEKDIKIKEAAKAKLVKAKKTLSWLVDDFTSLMTSMERSVMTTVYQEFAHLFSQWFNILIEDETLQVRLNEDFEPIAEQNGYETDIMSLSGGEKTACALAYRLALNKVINDLIEDIRTKDLLILDEPTDGFSTEQLDRMRELLDMIAIRQVIIVSHETKIESFVENIIRIEKTDHESTAIY